MAELEDIPVTVNMTIAPNFLIHERGTTDWMKIMRTKISSDHCYVDDDSGKELVRLVGLQEMARMAGLIRSYPVHTPFAAPGKDTVFICTYHLHFSDGTEWAGSADSNRGSNGREPYSFYPSSIAESRAEARAIRKALGITIYSAEEIDISRADYVPSPTTKIDSQVANAIQNLAKQKGIALPNLLDSVLIGERASTVSSLESLTSEEGANLMRFLNSPDAAAPAKAGVSKAKSKRDAKKAELQAKQGEV